MGSTSGHELYPEEMVALLQAVWGEGFLSPGGPEEVARILGGADVTGAAVLDIGCGAGGADVALVATHGAGYVTGIDVEDTVLAHARALVARRGLSARIGLAKVVPGLLPFPPATFDVVFSKEAIVHIPDKAALMAEVFRVLRPGGRFIASDWLLGHDGPPSAAMTAYIAAEGLDFGMAGLARYAKAMRAAGFVDVATTSRNAWYREVAQAELARLRGAAGQAAAALVGAEYVARNVALWERMIGVLATGEHCPTHLRAVKPAAR